MGELLLYFSANDQRRLRLEQERRLARLRADGTVDASFTGSANGTVRTLLVAGSRVYLGGEFSQVNGSPRQRLAALDAGTLALDPTFAPSIDGGAASVCAIAVDGGTLYVGGAFTSVNGAGRTNLAAVDAQ